MTMTPKLRFQRFEFKYVLDPDQFKAIRKYLRQYLEPDDFVRKSKQEFYEVVSLYYDSPRFFYFWEKIDGRRKRKKIRLRTYKNDGKWAPISFFEIKRKVDMVIFKDRFVLSPEDLSCFEKEGALFNINNIDKHKKDIVDEFHFERGIHSLSPKLLVVYNREPYLGKYNTNVRVTFDYSIRARESAYLGYDDDHFNDVSGDRVIMELKFRGSLPFYIERVIKEHNLGRVPYSKYCEGLEASYSLPMITMLCNKSQSDTLTLNSSNLLG